MGLQSRTSLASLAIQRRIVEERSDQPFHDKTQHSQEHKWQAYYNQQKQRRISTCRRQDLALVRLFYQQQGLSTASISRSSRPANDDALIQKLRKLASSRLNRVQDEGSAQTKIAHEYESLTDELVRISDYLLHKESTTELTEPSEKTSKRSSFKPIPARESPALKEQEDSLSRFRLRVNRQDQTGPEASKSLLALRLDQPLSNLDGYRESIKKAIESPTAKPHIGKNIQVVSISPLPHQLGPLSRHGLPCSDKNTSSSQSSPEPSIHTGPYQLYLSLLNY